MTPLGELAVGGAAGVFEARRRVRRLAEELGLDSMAASRVALAVSELGRRGGGTTLALGLRQGRGRLQLVLSADPSLGTRLGTELLERSFRPGPGALELTVDLPAGAEPASEELERLRELLRVRSRAELMREIQAQNQQLEATVEARTAELREASLAAQQANVAKSAFLSSMSHELRTPLNGVLGYVQILLRDRTLVDRQRDQLRSVESCGQHLLALINDVLDLSKIESGRLEVTPAACDLEGLLRAVVDIVRQRAEAKGLAFRQEVGRVPAAIRTDGPKLRQVLVNTLGNAVKFTSRGGVTLRVGEAPRGRLSLAVEDTGMGIAPEELGRIFEPFKQSEAGRVHGGTGLGLAISKRIVEALGGTLTVTSTVGVGSRFEVSIPLEEVEPALAQVEEGSKALLRSRDLVLAPGRRVDVLVADDRPENRDILVQLLEEAGLRTATADDGQAALDLLRSDPTRFRLALMDVHMPRKDGVQATRELRADPALRGLKVVAVTASVFSDTREKLLKDGFDDLLAKPIRVAELFAALGRHLDISLVDREPDSSEAVTMTRIEAPRPKADPAEATAPGVRPSQDVVLRLRELAELGDVGGLQALAAQVGGGLGERIGGLALAFDFDGVAAVADELGDAR